MEVDGGSIVLAIPIAVGHSLDLFDLGVEGFRNGVSDSVFQVGQDVGKVVLDGLGGFDDRL